ncbi:hypothetical protein D9M69_653430 [compost metagenome]
MDTFELDPVAGFPRPVRPVKTLADNALQAEATGVIEESDRISVDIFREPDRALMAAQRVFQQMSPRPIFYAPEIMPIEIEKIEDIEDRRRSQVAGPTADRAQRVLE